MNEFTLGAFSVDVSRCQLVQGQDIVTVEPRCMAVLAYLAARPGQVVTQESLFDALWPNQVFSPGAVQRCIAQLRKALQDDAKAPTYILTHPKRGYSLEVEPQPVQSRAAHRTKLLWMIPILVVLTLVWYLFRPTTTVKLTGQIQPVTSTSFYDFYPTFAPDGNRLAFIRQTPDDNQIVLKAWDAGAEKIVWRDQQNVQSLAWSKDGLTLFYVVRHAGGDVLAKLDLATGQQSELHRHAEQGEIWRVFAAGDRLFFMVANVPVNRAPHSTLYGLELLTGELHVLLQSSPNFTPYRVALSGDSTQLAVAGEATENQVEFRLFDLVRGELSEPFATLPLGFTEIAWHPHHDRLLVHHLNSLYWLDLHGEFQLLPYNSYLRVFNPAVTPQGDQVVMSQTEYDTDLIQLNTVNNAVIPWVDSTGEDHLASLSHDGLKLAYVSARSGVQQVWIKQGHEHQRVFDNPQNLPIYRAPVWSHDGTQLAFAFANSLYLFDVETQDIAVKNMPDHFTSILDWYGQKDALLIATKRDNTSSFESLSLSDLSMTTLHSSGVNFSARLDSQDRIVFGVDGKLHWGKQVFVDPLFDQVRGQFIPFEESVFFQSGIHLYRFHPKQGVESVNTLPSDDMVLQDVFGADRFLFQTASSRRAKIVMLR